MLSLIPDKGTPLNVLCLGAHCDDIEIGFGGTFLNLKRSGKIGEVYWVVFSSGEERKQEALNSAGYYLSGLKETKVEIHDFRDGFMPSHVSGIKEKFEEVKKSFHPHIVFTHYRHDRHQDHRTISDLAWNTFRNQLILEYEIPKWDGDLGVPNMFVELDEAILEEKISLLYEAYPSQAKKHWFDRETFKALPRLRGMESSVKYAEAFYTRKLQVTF